MRVGFKLIETAERDFLNDVSKALKNASTHQWCLAGLLSMLTDWELWAVARRFVDEHGDMAAGYASLKAVELEAQGDVRGRDVFLAVAARINALASPHGTRH